MGGGRVYESVGESAGECVSGCVRIRKRGSESEVV